MRRDYILLLIVIIGTIAIGCTSRGTQNQISEEEAKKIAINTAYGNNVHLMEIAQKRNMVLNVEKNVYGDYIIQVCDLNIECVCRENEGYWVKVKYDGSSSSIIKTNMCPFG